MNRPTYQRKQAHRRRLALGRAMHQVFRHRPRRDKHRHGRTVFRLHIPKLLRKHALLLRRVWAHG